MHALNLAMCTLLTLSPKAEHYMLITIIYGPLPSESVGKILGRSGLTLQGFIVHPFIVDWGSKEAIKIMTYVKKEMQINAEDRIAQLLLIHYIKGKTILVERTGTFESTGKYVLCKRVVDD